MKNARKLLPAFLILFAGCSSTPNPIGVCVNSAEDGFLVCSEGTGYKKFRMEYKDAGNFVCMAPDNFAKVLKSCSH